MLLVTLLYSVIILLLYLWVTFRPATAWARWSPIAVLILALVVRLVPALLLETGAPFDIQSYEVVASVVRSGEDVYTTESTLNRHPYLPMQLYWLAGAQTLAEGSGIPYVKVVKLLPILADVALAAAIMTFWRRKAQASNETPTDNRAIHMGLLYAINPVALLVCAYHGQFDAEPILGMTLATMAIALPPASATAQAWRGGAWLGFGILAKSYPVLALPALLPSVQGWRNRAIFVAAMLAVPLAGVLLYAFLFDRSVLEVVSRAVGYNSGVGIYGYTYFARVIREVSGDGRWLAWAVEYGRYITVGLLGVVWWFKARHQAAAPALLTLLVAFFAVAHVFAIQYLMWLIPIALLTRHTRWLAAYTVAAYGYMVVAYWGLIFEPAITRFMPLPQADLFLIMPASLPIWVLCLAWLAARLRSPEQIATIDSWSHYSSTKNHFTS